MVKGSSESCRQQPNPPGAARRSDTHPEPRLSREEEEQGNASHSTLQNVRQNAPSSPKMQPSAAGLALREEQSFPSEGFGAVRLQEQRRAACGVPRKLE